MKKGNAGSACWPQDGPWIAKLSGLLRVDALHCIFCHGLARLTGPARIISDGGTQ